jgi:hypothetical protein
MTATPYDEKGKSFRNIVYEYNLAQALVLRYNHNMSMTETNSRLHREWMACHTPSGAVWPDRERRAEELLTLMGCTQYPKSVYAAAPKMK